MSLTHNAQLLADYVVRSFQDDVTITEQALKDRIVKLAPVVEAAMGKGTSESEQNDILKELLARLSVSMDLGEGLKADDIKPWLDSRRATIDPFYWTRFRNYLQKDWSPDVLRQFNRVTDSILDLCGNPYAKEEVWKRRGLVIGDVQSGKTATYTGLCCKAADAGYQVIVLLTGTLESLRRQTQKRLDEGFAGLDSSEFLLSKGSRGAWRKRAVGAGLDNQKRFAAVFTSRTKDFNKDVLNSRQLTLSAVREPVLFVVKKNKNIIENLTAWLKAYNADSGGNVRESLLVIDDEADNASVNTNKGDTEPTAVNRCIRSLLNLFTRSTYIGFTATPFANVFIDPDTTDRDFYKEELFPRDFIYALDAPTNYIGASRIFGIDSDSANTFIRELEDAEDIFPLKHKSTLAIEDLPQSLQTAIKQFILVNTIRDLRGDRTAHRSMLVNISRFTHVQDQTRDLIYAALEEMKQHIRSYSGLSNGSSEKDTVLNELHSLFLKEYQDCGFDWKQIRASLFESSAPISVQSVNQRSGAASLDYTKHAESGLRVIAIGGNSLSRGLTLEGLCISYFHRSTQAYDTLLQMGRWFGYRRGYEDLCRLWITADAQLWYSHVTLAAEELRDEVRRMRQLGLTPKDFGLKVRSHPDTLIVTARNKMRNSETVIRQISWSCEGAETTKLRVRSNDANKVATRALIRSLQEQHIGIERSEWGNPIARSVGKEIVANFLDSFEVHPHNFKLYVPDDEKEDFGLRKFIAETDEPKLQTWDIAFPQGGLDPINFLDSNIELRPLQRVVTTADSDQTVLISGAKARVGSRGVEREGIAKSIVDEEISEAKEKGKNVADHVLRSKRDRPLLLIYAVTPYHQHDESVWSGLTTDDLFIAYGLSFPPFDDKTPSKTVAYRVNQTWLRDHSIDDEYEESDEDDVAE
ncbi:Z1 domain-containing protein [Castellaniella sp.]|uniref:Z1 domain-containing protein n=1 Tax=Castellaniella sp. TaxID=1955812 RepID=UPI003C746DE8